MAWLVEAVHGKVLELNFKTLIRMKHLYILLVVLSGSSVFAQRTYFHTELSSVFPTSGQSIYSFAELDRSVFTGDITLINKEVELEEKVLWDLEFSYNYFLFRKFSVGAATGLISYSNPSVLSAKLGGVIRYTFIKEFKANAFITITGLFPFRTGFEIDMGQAKMGLSMPVAQFDKSELTLSLYRSYVTYTLTKPILRNEEPTSFHHRGWGLGLGLRF